MNTGMDCNGEWLQVLQAPHLLVWRPYHSAMRGRYAVTARQAPWLNTGTARSGPLSPIRPEGLREALTTLPPSQPFHRIAYGPWGSFGARTPTTCPVHSLCIGTARLGAWFPARRPAKPLISMASRGSPQETYGPWAITATFNTAVWSIPAPWCCLTRANDLINCVADRAPSLCCLELASTFLTVSHGGKDAFV